ncbi:heat shock protein 67B1 [Brienomyrus brachyistius]|uniref:heat shock protein 67B1 n=1 Tax=Brienomyrus brachyistius TaxID=42636 RepID=UPI0020B1AFF5|nr:heat shock protein 67B1 [Brienomyrus brachyistius]
MSGREEVLTSPQFCRDVRWDPFRDWVSPSLIFGQEFTSAPLSDTGDHTWTRRCLGSSSWPGYTPSHFLAPPTQATLYPSFRLLKQSWAGLSEVRSSQGMWTISLDVNQFSPEEITVRMKEGYLEITGSHDERRDEHGSVTRCFTRKYNLPDSTDLEKMRSYLSGDGVLSVEIPLAASGDLGQQKTVIPVQVGERPVSLKEEDEEKVEKMVEGRVEGSSSEDKNSEVTDSPTAATQASGEEPGVEDPQPQIPGIISAGSPEGQQGEQPAGTGEGAAGPSDQKVPLEQAAGDQDAGGSIQREEEQGPFGVEKDDTQQEAWGQPESPEQPGLAQREQEGIIQKEAALQASEEPPAEGVKPVPSQSDAAQHPELDVLEKHDTVPVVEQFTKS